MRTSIYLSFGFGVLLFSLTPAMGFGNIRRPTLVAHQGFFGESENLAGSRMWRAPSYLGQTQAVGWSVGLFQENSASLQKRVQFWKDIYTKYSTNQGVIHDSDYIDLIYARIDFSDIDASLTIGPIEKQKMKQRRIETEKEQINSLLLKLAEVKDSRELQNERERYVWNYFANNIDPYKFKKAANKDRIRFQLGLSDRMQKAIFVSGRYLEDMENIFREEGVPIELTRLVFVESSFNVLARSKVGASGLWQIMPGTARPHGYLKVQGIDRRNHPLEATRLAARILRDAYNLLQSWPLAVTAYNHGPNGMKRLSSNYKTTELGELIESVRDHESFGFASKNFYASFVAAVEVEKNAPAHFKNVVWSRPFDAKKIRLPNALAVEKVMSWFNGDDYKFQVLNPHISKALMKSKHHMPKETEILVPSEKYTAAVIDVAFRPTRKIAAESKRDH